MEPSTELVYVRPAELASGRSVENSSSRYGQEQQGWDSDIDMFEDEHGSDDSEDSDEDALRMHTRVQDAGKLP